MSNPDQIQRFIFTDLDIRGQMVGMELSYQQTLENHQYPEPIQRLIGEFMAAAALLSTSIKFAGTLSIQAQGSGKLSMIMAECRHDQEVRAIARWQGEHCEETLEQLLGSGQLAITIDPDQGQRYQGIVALEGASLAECLECYFAQSEQLKTRIWLSAQPGEKVSGMLIQALPSGGASDQDAWSRIYQLTDTLTDQELQELENEQLLFRLYHEEQVRLFPPSAIEFKCNCDRDRTIKAIVSLGQEEVADLFEQQEQLTVKCEFCHKDYHFHFDDVAPYLMEQDINEVANDLAPSRTLH